MSVTFLLVGCYRIGLNDPRQEGTEQIMTGEHSQHAMEERLKDDNHVRIFLKKIEGTYIRIAQNLLKRFRGHARILEGNGRKDKTSNTNLSRSSPRVAPII